MKKSKKIDFSRISFVLMDLDGVMTDGSIMYTSTGEHIKVFHAHDGYGIERGHSLGLRFAIISGRTDSCNEHRAKKLKIEELFQGAGDKIAVFEELKSRYHLRDENFCFIGDDAFDIPLLKEVAFSCAPQNAVKEVKYVVDYVTRLEGGKGAVREVIDLILKKKKLI